MRVISGILKGRSIRVPSSFSGRPTTDFAREGLFNVLNNLAEFENASVLDLFSGTGAFSIECFSRGASKLTCVESNTAHAKAIRENFLNFAITGGKVLRQDAFRFLKQPAAETHDIIFADPPYDLPGIEKIPGMIFNGDFLSPDGIFILEHSKRQEFSDQPNFLQERKYSNVHFSFFRAS